jgi:hypothetical protein
MLFCWLYHTITIMIFDTHNMDVLALRASLQAQDMDDVFQALDSQHPDDVLGLIGSKVVECTSFDEDVMQVATRIAHEVMPAIKKGKEYLEVSAYDRKWTLEVNNLSTRYVRHGWIRMESGPYLLEWNVHYELLKRENVFEVRSKDSMVYHMIPVMSEIITRMINLDPQVFMGDIQLRLHMGKRRKRRLGL